MLVSGGGAERGVPLHLVKILPLGSFHALLADPSRKWVEVGVCVGGWYKEPPRGAPACTVAAH